MSVAVYPRLGKLLAAQGLSIDELRRQIERQFGLAVDQHALGQLADADPVQHPDIRVAGAAAAVLGVGLDAVFDVQTVPAAAEDAPGPIVSVTQRQRLSELLDQQSRRQLSDQEQAELTALVEEWGEQLHEWRLRQIAAQRGVTVAEARTQVAAELERALAVWNGLQAHPVRRRAIEAAARPPGRRRGGRR